MTIKKSIQADKWAEQAPHGERREQAKTSSEKKISFAARIPENLHSELKKYIEQDAKEKESINDIIVAGAKLELQARLEKRGKGISAEAKKEALFADIEKMIKELKALY